MKFPLLISLIFIAQLGYAQIKEMEPTKVRILDLSAEGEKAFIDNQALHQKISDKLSKGTKREELTQSERDVLYHFNEAFESYWDVMEGGCSWYCGGGPKEVTASSHLKSQGAIDYIPQNAHDLNYKNVWAEGVAGYGIGEYLSYTFDGNAPRITEIIVANGYVKSKAAWEDNSRVKKLKVYLDDKPFAILNLQDIRGAQTFKFKPIGNSDRNLNALKSKSDWTLKFEIMDVYKGLKYDDVVISELYFNGIDVHCFAKGTQILMADNSSRPIEELSIGDSVAYVDFEKEQVKFAKIEQLERVTHKGLVTYILESGKEITATQDHPFKIQGKGWASLKPYKSNQYKGFENVGMITVGDFFLSVDGPDKLKSIDYLDAEQETFTISRLSSGDNFIANGFVVGVETLKD